MERKLGRLSSFGCGGFEIRGAELADSADEHELLRRRPWRAEEKKESKARRREKWGMWRARERGVVDLAMPPTAEHAATFLDGHATASGGVGAITANRASPGETGRRKVRA